MASQSLAWSYDYFDYWFGLHDYVEARFRGCEHLPCDGSYPVEHDAVTHLATIAAAVQMMLKISVLPSWFAAAGQSS